MRKSIAKPEQNSDPWDRVRSARRAVIKLGTNTVNGSEGDFSAPQVAPLVRSIARLQREGKQIVLVSSGAVGLGAARLGLSRPRLQDVVMRQAAAAVGQSLLMHRYEQLFRLERVSIAQVLLTEADFTNRSRYLSLRRTIEKLLKLKVIPIVNENDTVSTAELDYLNDDSARVFSDNDRLAALVMSKLEADALVMLTNVDGLLNRQPLKSKAISDATAQVIPLVTENTLELKAMAHGQSTTGRGGMRTKLEAAEIAMCTGGVAVIANGTTSDILDRIFQGEMIGTVFLATKRLRGKQRWLAYAAEVRGRVIVNAGAREAIIARQASLLVSGVLRIEDRFDAEEVVSIRDVEGAEFARGIANYGSREAEDMVGLPGNKSARSNGAKARVLVSRDNIVVLEGK